MVKCLISSYRTPKKRNRQGPMPAASMPSLPVPCLAGLQQEAWQGKQGVTFVALCHFVVAMPPRQMLRERRACANMDVSSKCLQLQPTPFWVSNSVFWAACRLFGSGILFAVFGACARRRRLRLFGRTVAAAVAGFCSFVGNCLQSGILPRCVCRLGLRV